jgi:hypothetical protein
MAPSIPPANSLFTDKYLITAKPLVGVDEAIDLLQQHAKSEDRKREAAGIR